MGISNALSASQIRTLLDPLRDNVEVLVFTDPRLIWHPIGVMMETVATCQALVSRAHSKITGDEMFLCSSLANGICQLLQPHFMLSHSGLSVVRVALTNELLQKMWHGQSGHCQVVHSLIDALNTNLTGFWNPVLLRRYHRIQDPTYETKHVDSNPEKTYAPLHPQPSVDQVETRIRFPIPSERSVISISPKDQLPSLHSSEAEALTRQVTLEVLGENAPLVHIRDKANLGSDAWIDRMRRGTPNAVKQVVETTEMVNSLIPLPSSVKGLPAAAPKTIQLATPPPTMTITSSLTPPSNFPAGQPVRLFAGLMSVPNIQLIVDEKLFLKRPIICSVLSTKESCNRVTTNQEQWSSLCPVSKKGVLASLPLETQTDAIKSFIFRRLVGMQCSPSKCLVHESTQTIHMSDLSPGRKDYKRCQNIAKQGPFDCLFESSSCPDVIDFVSKKLSAGEECLRKVLSWLQDLKDAKEFELATADLKTFTIPSETFRKNVDAVFSVCFRVPETDEDEEENVITDTDNEEEVIPDTDNARLSE